MTDEKFKIVKFERPVNSRPDIIEAIEELLLLAKEGKILSYYTAALLVDDEILTTVSHGECILTGIGAIEHLKRRALDSMYS